MTTGVAGSGAAVDGQTVELCRWAADLDLDAVPRSVRRRAALLVLDGLGCALTAARTPWSSRAVEAVTALEPDDGIAVIGWGRTSSVCGATMLNSAFVQGAELDDYHPVAPLHGVAAVVPGLLALAQQRDGCAGEDLLRAVIVGFEVGPRVGMALGGGQMLTRGWHSGSVFGAPAAAMACGVLLGLDADGLESALGIACTQAGGLMGAQFGAESKRMQHGFAARNGLTAAVMAESGYTGMRAAIERDYGGLLSVLGDPATADADAAVAGLGERWETLRYTIKRYAAMGGLHAGIQAALALREQGVVATDVRRVEVGMAEAAFHHGGWRAMRPLTPVGAQMNIAYALAVSLLDGQALLEQFLPPRLDDDDVWNLVERMHPVLDPALEAGDEKLATRVTVELADHRVVEQLVTRPRGGLDDPITEEEIRRKFHELAGPAVGMAAARELETAVDGLDEPGGPLRLVELIAAHECESG